MTTISKISEAFDISYVMKLGTVDKLTFRIPVKVEKDRAFIHNHHIDMAKPRYLIKMIVDKKTEYFVITETSKSMNQSGKTVTFSVYGLGYELIDKNIRRYEQESANLREHAEALVEGERVKGQLIKATNWKIDYVDEMFTRTGTNRTYEVTSKTVLQAIYDLAKVYNALILWNTRDRKISFVRPQSVGSNKGLRFQNGKYLESADIKIDATETITRLKPYGKDNITIADVHILGVPYLESFKWYMYPFEMDSNGNVLQSSHYFSDDMCKAIIAYEELVVEKAEDFKLMQKQLEIHQKALFDSESKISELETELKIAWDKIDVSNASVEKDANLNTPDLPPEHWELVAEKDRIQRRLDRELDNRTEIDVLVHNQEKEIRDLRKLLSRENNFTPPQIDQMLQFTIEKEYNASSVEMAEDLLEDAKKAFEELSKPKISARVNIVNFLESIEAQHDWNKLNLGDDVYVEESDLEFSIKAKITQITFNFETKNINLTIENELDTDDKISEMLESGVTGNAIINHDKWEWDLSKENNGMINDIINNKWEAEKNAIEAGYEQLIEISERGIIVTSPDEPCKKVIIQAGRIALTQDCGNTWKTAINPDGIWAEQLWGKVISGVNLIIEDESGIWRTQGSRTTVFNRDREEVMRLGLVTDEDPECFGISSWNDVTKVELTDCSGFAISKWNVDKDDWKKVLWASPDGTIMSRQMVAENIKIVNDIGDYIMDAESGLMDLGALKDILADLVITPMEKLELVQVLLNVYEEFIGRYRKAQDHYYSQRNTTHDYDAAFDTEEGIFPIIDDSTVIVGKNKFSLTKFQLVSHAYGKLMRGYLPYLSFEGDQVPRYLPKANEGIIDPYKTVATNFVPEKLRFVYGTELMRSNSEIELPERKKLMTLLEEMYNAFAEFDKNMTEMLFHSGLQMGKFYNNIIIDDYGFIAVRNDGKYRSVLNATHGLVIEQWNDEKKKWIPNLYGSKEGELVAKNLIAEGLKIVNSVGDYILDAEKDFMDMGALENILVDLVITPMEKVELAKTFAHLHEAYTEAYLHTQKHYYSQRDTVYDFEAAYDTKKSSFPVTRTPEENAEDENTLSQFALLQLAYGAALQDYSPIISLGTNTDGNKLPQIAPDPSIHNVIGNGSVATDFVPERLVPRLNTELMKTNYHIADEQERYALFSRIRWVYDELKRFNQRLVDNIYYSGLQMGEYYNNVIVDNHGFIAVRNDGKYRAYLNATHGLALQKWEGNRWVSKLYGTLGHPDWEDGTLYAEGMVTKNLKIVDGDLGEKITFDHKDGITIYGENGEVIRLNGNVGINMEVKGEKRFWFGKDGYIYAKKIHIMGEDEDELIEDVEGSYISDLTVNRLKTLNSNKPQDFVHVEDNYIKLVTNTGTAELPKFALTFEPIDGQGSSPIMRWGAGAIGNPNANTFVQYKTSAGFYSKYTHTDSNFYSHFNLHRNGTDLETSGKFVAKAKQTVIEAEETLQLKVGSNDITINKSGIKINGNRIDFSKA